MAFWFLEAYVLPCDVFFFRALIFVRFLFLGLFYPCVVWIAYGMDGLFL